MRLIERQNEGLAGIISLVPGLTGLTTGFFGLSQISRFVWLAIALPQNAGKPA